MGSTRIDHMTLYMNPYSVRSTMIRLAIALRGEARADAIPIIVQEHEVDIFEMEQLEERFMFEVNGKGQVPVLAGPNLPEPLTETLDITEFLMSRYPSLSAPEQYLQEAEDLLEKLHGLDFFPLSFGHTPGVADHEISFCEQQIKQNTSQRHIKLLEAKLVKYKSQKERIVTKEKLAALEKSTMDFLSECRVVMRRNSGPWIYGRMPTALDAHLIPFLQRMKDAGHFDYFHDDLGGYLDAGTNTPEWNSVMRGRKTLPQAVVVGIPKE
ncbi:MAG: hypothetical protein M1820_004492 [Bogoriella megaspora]|nr:MAG: hypothetical protein M1820_004492 [Bogoriella megaspora]